MRKLTIVFFDAGGGHRNAATALKSVIEMQRRPWQVELLDLQQALRAIDPLRGAGGARLPQGYNLLLRKGWTRLSPQLLSLLQCAIRRWHAPMVRQLGKIWRESRPDLILSVIPNFNRALAESARLALPGSPFVTLMTDLADYPPHFWVERESQYIICGTPRALDQALEAGVNPRRCFLVSGMLLHPRFYERVEVDRATGRKQLGLRADLVTALVLFGGHGASAGMLRVVRTLQRSPTPLQMIVLCGRNERAVKRLRKMPAAKPIFVEGFTDRVNHYMSLSDLFIGKPGPGSLSEALHFQLPVIVERNGKTLPQERYNTEWVEQTGVGHVLKSFSELDSALAALSRDGALERCRTSAASLKNRAIFEVSDILAGLLKCG